MVSNRWVARLVGLLVLLVIVYTLLCTSSMQPGLRPWPLSVLDGGLECASKDTGSRTLSAGAPGSREPWFPPRTGLVNNLTAALYTPSGVYGFRYDGSLVPDADYGVYNWCNMPHVRRDRYVVPPPSFALRYVELVHRHHKRTPYAANAFPVEPYHWDCSDAQVHHYNQPTGTDHHPGDAFLRPDAAVPGNPFAATAPGLHGSCRFPQLTHGGLVDAWQHGADLYGVYHDLLHFLPDLAANDSSQTEIQAAWTTQTAFRVTNNQITSETASMVWGGMLAAAGQRSPSWSLPFSVEPVGVDGLEPQYDCPAGAVAFADITGLDIDSVHGDSRAYRSRAWNAHLVAAADVFRRLDAASGVLPGDRDFHSSFDHYYDSLSARRCHDLPDVVGVDRNLADTVFRLGQWEYSRMFRDDARSLGASAALWGVWVAQLAAHLRTAAADRQTAPRYRHNVAHDGSLSRLLSILQADDMVWPGMGSEVVVELWEKTDHVDDHVDQDADVNADISTHPHHYIRVLFGGRLLRSSHPDLADLDMRPLDALLAYLDDLVGPDASLVPRKCNGTLALWPRSAADVTCPLS
ncbi:histidine acid phosphatase [Grosmannia clavigera kw1407]|uniref:Histidine acid phosphatase n=1 Tax=Grosmannia clavigera (strain kw1407 / UAMH 11150) TaxID=655863 RepID=F0XV47_GROCL|nr:histidine acid phosphatase [Grosmannia clavigera kw1407]EFW98684.1 histidine acid phosphatase [Grosmannia clavigera kw1407]